MSPRRGRRAGATRTREAILEVARRRFEQLGYDRTTIRGIAAEVGVDPALVRHFFGSKPRLFAEVVEPDVDADVVARTLRGADPARLGEHVAAMIARLLGAPDSAGRIVAVLRASASEPAAAELLRDRLKGEVLMPVVVALDIDQPELRTELIAAQILGLAMARDVVAFPSLAATDIETLGAAIAPALQHILTGDLGLEGAEHRRGPPSSS